MSRVHAKAVRWSCGTLVSRAFRFCVLLLPAPIRYLLTLVAFWPTVLLNRAICWLRPSKRQLWNRVAPHVILGSAPFRQAEVEQLYKQEQVRGVINLCKEWNWHAALYRQLGIHQLCLPTIDYDVPAYADCVAGADFIHAHASRGDTVYVHCKAGRGRSTAIVLCYLIKHCGLTPEQADAQVRKARPHISKRDDAAQVQQIYRETVDAKAA